MKLPTPQRGQPLDVSFIGDIVSSINSLWDKITVSAAAYTNIWYRGGNKAKVKITETAIVAGKIETSLDTQKANGVSEFIYRFDLSFKYPPIVTATPENASVSSELTKGLRVVLTTITENSVSGIIVFENAGAAETANTKINIIAIGIPN